MTVASVTCGLLNPLPGNPEDYRIAPCAKTFARHAVLFRLAKEHLALDEGSRKTKVRKSW